MCTNDKMLAHGISVVSYSDKRGPDIARKSFKSRAWTMSKFGDIVKAIEGKYAEYSARWPRLPAGADPTRYIIVKTGRGRGAVEEYVALDPGVEKGNGELVIVGEVAVPPAGFSAIDYPRVVNKAGIDTSSWVLPAGVSMVVEENIDDLAGLL
jgi:hypothetical protein